VGPGASHDISEKRKKVSCPCWKSEELVGYSPVNNIKVDLTGELAIISLQPKTPTDQYLIPAAH
jgi:hypothetical protein